MLQEDAVRSAQIYLDYLIAHKDEGLGMVRARVRGIQGSLLSEEMVLFVDRVLRSAENLVLRVGGTVYENTPEQMYFRIVSVNRRKVVMAPSPEVAEHISCFFRGHAADCPGASCVGDLGKCEGAQAEGQSE